MGSGTAAEELLAAAAAAASAKAGGISTAWGGSQIAAVRQPYMVDEGASWDASAECSDEASETSQHGGYEADETLQLLIDHGSLPPAGAGMLAATLEHSSAKLAGSSGLGGAQRCLVPMPSAFAAVAAAEAALRAPSSSPPTTRGSPVGSSPTWLAGPGRGPAVRLGAGGQHGYAELPGAPNPNVKASWWFRFYYWGGGNGSRNGIGNGTGAAGGGGDKDATHTAAACVEGGSSGPGGAAVCGPQVMVADAGAGAGPGVTPTGCTSNLPWWRERWGDERGNESRGGHR